MYYNSSQTFGLHCPDRDIGLQTFDSEEALRLVHHFLPQTLSNDSIHLSVCPSFSTKICLLLRRDQPLSCLQPFIASSKGARKDRLTLPLVLSCGVTSFQHNGTETLGDAPNFPQATITLRSRHYLLLLLCSALLLRFDVPPLQLCTKYPKQQHTAPPEVQTIANHRPQAHRTTSPHQRAISYLRALGTSSLV
ncbi:hypothetical protein CTAM01_02731 [Colletotrichum tamarilloi]|uniref:Uncharacterized protein n=1 Tax=Colletotrichum tamarilloi TaxID=1209934 RepID=A0ABQ9RM93_9PEZI|nr:uncharacterized protein CTAM01_02731 [Colletotrichum tamarilloi]KAK1507619.1 hypothetical protein CTAM01_02731 [Colletotrichum tamarilloi]